MNQSLNHDDSYYIQSEKFLEKARVGNLAFTILAILVGLIGNGLTIIVFSQNKFRTNSSNAYLLCLALNDSLFLVVHFFEDTIRTYKILFIDPQKLSTSDSFAYFIITIMVIDKFDIICRCMSFMRNFLRFISAYIIVAFTVQRVLIISLPLSKKFKTKKSAWLTVNLILLVSFISNSWTPFFFELRENNHKKYCDVKISLSSSYKQLTLFYISTTMFIPILIIFISNLIIITYINRVDLKKTKQSLNGAASQGSKKVTFQDEEHSNTTIYFLEHDKIKRISNLENDSRKITKILLLISFSYAFLNLPYLITWIMYFNSVAFSATHFDPVMMNYLFSLLQIFEVVQLLNYCLTFYIYCASSSIFRNQLSYSGFSCKTTRVKNDEINENSLFLDKL